jgi:ribosomal protein S18 acetylase RimI-like enzyme
MKARFAIRPAVLADLDRILEIEAASFGREAYDRKLFAYYLRRCAPLFLVAARRARVAGYMITCMRGDRLTPRAELVSIAVDPASRQAGAASALLESALRRLRPRGATRLHLVVRVSNRAARVFYEKYRFRPSRVLRGYYEDGGDGIAMTRPVAGPLRFPDSGRGRSLSPNTGLS